MMIKNFLMRYVENDNEVIVTTHITTPFLKRSTIIDASKKLKKANFVHSVSEHKHFAWLKKDNKYKPNKMLLFLSKAINISYILVLRRYL